MTNQKQKEEAPEHKTPPKMPKISYNILHWIADDALLLKKLCSLCDRDIRRETRGDIKSIILEISQLNDGLKDYYISRLEGHAEDPSIEFTFIQELLIKCYEKQSNKIFLFFG